jgi:hypothetical protein
MAGVDYYQHLCSREWALKRKAVRERAGASVSGVRRRPLRIPTTSRTGTWAMSLWRI